MADTARDQLASAVSLLHQLMPTEPEVAGLLALIRLLTRAARRQRPGPYQLQAAIVACHAEAERWADTDWEQIVLLYDMLLYLAPSPVTRLHRAIAVRYTTGAQDALAELDELAPRPRLQIIPGLRYISLTRYCAGCYRTAYGY